MLDKKGHSHTDERIDLLGAFFEVFPDAQIDYLSTKGELLVGQD